jgi:hypothetical protein
MRKFFHNLTQTSIRGVIAIIVIISSFGFLFSLLHYKIPPENKEVVTVSAGLILAGMGVVLGYYFGASKDKTDNEKSSDRVIVQKAQPDT